MKREIFSSGGKWEPIIGYSRTVKVGDLVFVSGCTAADAGGQVSGDAYAQTVKTLANVRRALELAGAKPDHVVRSIIFLQNIDDWEAVGRAHGEVFGAIRPAATMIEVSRFIAPEMLIEIQVDAVISD
jgi:enamine deaminase RidA (YjgF/YER057c/UK114 family)